MKIITAGCSFTRYKWSCWPNFVKWFEPKHEIINVGNSASSNETIMRSVYNSVFKYADIKKIYIMWSGANRYEVVVDKQPDKSKEDATWSRYDQIGSGFNITVDTCKETNTNTINVIF